MKRGNNVSAEVLKLTRNTDSQDVRRTFELMWERAKMLKPALIFDPLGQFELDDIER